MRRNPWVERAKNVLIALLAVILLALTVLALPVKTVTDTPWLAALVRPFASLMGISQGDLTDTPMADDRTRHGRRPAGSYLCAKPRRADELSVFVLHTGHVV